MSHIKRHNGRFRYKEKDVEYTFWSNTVSGQKPDTVIFLGAGQTGIIARMVAARAGSGVVVICGVPHWHADANSEDVTRFTKTYFETVYRQVLGVFTLSSMHLLAESQAAPVAILLSITMSAEIKNVTLIRPLGFSVKDFGESMEVRLRTFKKRIRQTLLQYPQSFLYDPRNLAVILVMMRAMLREPSRASLHSKYGIGISYDSLQDLERAAAIRHQGGRTITIILGEKDKIFPPGEIMTALRKLHIPYVHIIVLSGVSHSPLATRAGTSVLKAALKAVRT